MTRPRSWWRRRPELMLALQCVAAAYGMTPDDFLAHMLRAIIAGDPEERR